jgi:molybdenum cofactor guanylyltransferase
MSGAAGVVLAGGRSARMGRSKAALEWHDSTVLRRVAGIVGRAVGGPVVVVRAPRQPLPALPPDVVVVEDAREGRGPLEGLAAGLAALEGRAAVAYVSATDVPLLHPAFVRRVVAALEPDADVALPVLGGRPHPLSAAYRVALRGVVDSLLADDRLRAAALLERCRVRRLDAAALLADRALAGADPALHSVLNVNEPADYEAARARPVGEVTVRGPGAPDGRGAGAAIRAATLGAAAAAVGVQLGGGVVVAINGGRVSGDPEEPLVEGDRVVLSAASPGA